jgi:hypothetical protein
LGYRAEVAVALDRDPDMKRHPKFDFDRFGEYLTRGVWPFLINLILYLPLIPLGILAIVVGLVIDPPGPNNLPILAFILLELVIVVAEIFHPILSVPMMFHAEITGRFDLGGAFRFARSFWALVGWVAIGTGLVYMFLALVITILGLLFFCVGVYPASAIVHMAGQHLMCQLYRLYLIRGGEPLEEFKPPRRRREEPEFDDEYDDDHEDEVRR